MHLLICAFEIVKWINILRVLRDKIKMDKNEMTFTREKANGGPHLESTGNNKVLNLAKPLETLQFGRRGSRFGSGELISQPPSSRSLKPTFIWVVNYPKTYRAITADKFYVKSLATNIRETKKVLSSGACRSNLEIHLLRVVSYQVCIVSCQYANKMCLLMLIGIELTKVLHATYCYIKYKYLKNIICQKI